MINQTALKTWGNSQGILIPKRMLKELQWDLKDALEMEVVDNEIRIRRPFVHKTFEERLAAYNGEISVCDFDWGEPGGKEML